MVDTRGTEVSVYDRLSFDDKQALLEVLDALADDDALANKSNSPLLAGP